MQFSVCRLTLSQWALLELSRNPDVQTMLRDELLEHGADPTYDQLSNDLPYLNAVVHEIHRIHPPVGTVRVVRPPDIPPPLPPRHLSFFHRPLKMMLSRSLNPSARNVVSWSIA
jgi:hypothetical protein